MALRQLAAAACSSSGRAPAAAPALLRRWLSSPAAPAVEALTEAEKQIAQQIAAGMSASSIKVADTSGGCGAMYSIEVVSGEFAGKSIVKQHQMVTRLLKDQISQWHGFQLVTRAP